MTRKLRKATGFTLALLAGAGCPGGGGAADAGPDGVVPGGTVEIGTGTTRFVAITPEQTVEMVRGPQGGHHFVVHARAKDIAYGVAEPGLPENPTTRFSAYRADGRQIDLMFPAWHGGYVASGTFDGWWVLASQGRILQVEESEIPALYGTRVQLSVLVTDVAGHRVLDSRQVIAGRPFDEPDGDAGPPDAGPPDGP